MSIQANHYEIAFESYLVENRIPYISVDQQKRNNFLRNSVKSFDFLVYPSSDQMIIVELKGRKFKGTTLNGLKGFQCWIGIDDVHGLSQWQKVLEKDRANVRTLIVFVYAFEHIDVETDGFEVYDFDNRRYFFLCVFWDDYSRHLKRRSRSWKTGFISADDFRKVARPVSDVLL